MRAEKGTGKQIVFINHPLTTEQRQKLSYVEYWRRAPAGTGIVSTEGRVYVGWTNRYTPGCISRGYCFISTGVGYTTSVHSLVYKLFIGPVNKGNVIDHINNIHWDNRLVNLQQISNGDNTRKSRWIDHKDEPYLWDGAYEVTQVKTYCLEKDKVYKSISECARQLNLDVRNIFDVLNHRNNTCGGYHFCKYIEGINPKDNFDMKEVQKQIDRLKRYRKIDKQQVLLAHTLTTEQLKLLDRVEYWRKTEESPYMYVSTEGRYYNRNKKSYGYGYGNTRQVTIFNPINSDKHRIYPVICNLVYTLFVGEIPEGMKVAHIDSNNLNNNLINLELRAHSRNSNSKKVLCIETGIIYGNSRIASEIIGCSSKGIRRSATNHSKKYLGRHFVYIDDLMEF